MKISGYIVFLVFLTHALQSGSVPFPMGKFSADIFFLPDKKLYEEWRESEDPIIRHQSRFVDGDKFVLGFIFANAAVGRDGRMDVTVTIRGFSPDGANSIEESAVKISSSIKPAGRDRWYLTPMRLDITLEDEPVGVHRLEVEFHDRISNLRKLCVREFEVLEKLEDIEGAAVEEFKLQSLPRIMLNRKFLKSIYEQDTASVDINLKTRVANLNGGRNLTSPNNRGFKKPDAGSDASIPLGADTALPSKPDSSRIKPIVSDQPASSREEGNSILPYAVPLVALIILITVAITLKRGGRDEGQ